MNEQIGKGRILSVRSGTSVTVLTEGERVRCRAMGKLRETGLLPGDTVDLRRESAEEGIILSVDPRKNRFVRPAVANVDRLILVISAAPPVTDRQYIDGMCAMAAYMNTRTVLCLNKTDRHPGEALSEIYRKAGYTVLSLSAETGEGIEMLIPYLTSGITVFAGNSGVGKSSLINRLLKEELQKTGDLSPKIGRGRNTTRHAELSPTRFGGLICDTPGFSTFRATEMGMTDPDRLPDCFPEFKPYLCKCRYTDCGHTSEEGCALLQAVSAGAVDEKRHACYLALLQELKDYKRRNYYGRSKQSGGLPK